MACRITYNSKNIDFTRDPYRYDPPQYRRIKVENRSVLGVCETLLHRIDVVVSISFRNFLNSDATDATLKRKLNQFAVWAQSGGTWTFAYDSGEVVNTTLTGAEAAGQTVIGVTSSTGVDASGLYVIRSHEHAELVHIASVDSGSQVTLTETLNHAYASGSRFRSERYWPARLISFALTEHSTMRWGLDLQFYEDVNSL